MNILPIQEVEVIIASGQSIAASSIPADGRMPFYLDSPVGFEGTTIGFCTADGLRTLRGAFGQELVLTLGAAGSRHCLLDQGLGQALMRMRGWRIYAGASFSSRTTQAAARSLIIGFSEV